MGLPPSGRSTPMLMAEASTVPMRMGSLMAPSPALRSCGQSTTSEATGPPPTTTDFMSILLSDKKNLLMRLLRW